MLHGLVIGKWHLSAGGRLGEAAAAVQHYANDLHDADLRDLVLGADCLVLLCCLAVTRGVHSALQAASPLCGGKSEINMRPLLEAHAFAAALNNNDEERVAVHQCVGEGWLFTGKAAFIAMFHY